jgi:hypothetical protein
LEDLWWHLVAAWDLFPEMVDGFNPTHRRWTGSFAKKQEAQSAEDLNLGGRTIVLDFALFAAFGVFHPCWFIVPYVEYVEKRRIANLVFLETFSLR